MSEDHALCGVQTTGFGAGQFDQVDGACCAPMYLNLDMGAAPYGHFSLLHLSGIVRSERGQKGAEQGRSSFLVRLAGELGIRVESQKLLGMDDL